jgi:O-antigen/teichoic acid export membrane protein
MSTDSLARLSNIALRGLTLTSKFALVFFLAKLLEPDQLGLFGLLAATIGFALYVLGFEFYSYSTREILGAAPQRRLGFIRDQAAFHVVAYAVSLPLLLLVFWRGWLPWSYLPWLLALLVLEHIAQELNRILVAVSQQLVASMVLFLRSGAWCWVAVTAMWYVPSTRSIHFVLAAWTVGVAMACALAIDRVLRFDRTALAQSIDWGWIAAGLKVAAPLLLASLSVRAIFTIDRYWVESTASLGTLGAYVLFIGMASAVLSFLDAGVIDFLYPRLVVAAKAGDDDTFRKGMAALQRQIIVVTGSLCLACWLLSEPLLKWLGKPIYLEHLYVLKWLLLAVAIYAVGLIPHVGLYARGKDRALVLSQLAGFTVFLAAAIVGDHSQGLMGVARALCLAFSVMLLWKVVAYRSLQQGRASAVPA